MLEFEASVEMRFESTFASPLEHTRQGPYLLVTKKLYDRVLEYSNDNL